MVELTIRQKKIINFLLVKQGEYVKGEQIASLNGVSSRTIRDEINSIRFILKNSYLDSIFSIISIPTKGYKLEIINQELFYDLIKEFEVSILTNDKESANYITRLIRLLVLLHKDITIEDLENLIYYNESTIRQLIGHHNLTNKRNYRLITNRGHIYPEGNEREIRIGIMHSLFVNPKFIDYNEKLVDLIYDKEFVDYVEKTIKFSVCKRNDISICSEAIHYYAVWLFVFKRRNEMGYDITISDEEIRMIKQYECELKFVDSICDAIETEYDYYILKNDRFYLTMLMACFVDDDKPLEKNNDLLKYVYNLTVNEYGNSLLTVGVLERSLKHFFRAFELRNHFSINRQYLGVSRVYRRMTNSVLFAHYVANQLNIKFGFKLSDKEIVFLGVCLDDYISICDKKTKKNILVSSKFGLFESMRFSNSLKFYFNDFINKIEVCDTYRLRQYEDNADLIFIDTLDFDETQSYKYIYHKPYINALNLPLRANYWLNIFSDKYYFCSLLKQENFKIDVPIPTRNAALEYIASLLETKKLSKEVIYHRLNIQNIELSNETGFEIAIINIIDKDINEQLFFIKLSNIIQWDLRYVHFLIVATSRSFCNHHKMNDGLTSLVKDNNTAARLISEPTPETIFNLLQVDIDEGRNL